MLPAADLRANAARHAAAAASGSSPTGGTLTSSELLRRLRDTQALLIKFSEENGRLSADNQQLQANRKALGAEHANVLDEIDLLRGKLSQLESNVLAAAAAASTAGGSAGPAGAAVAGPGPQQAATGTAAAATGGRGGGGVLDLRSLLQSLGLGEEVVGGLLEVGVGPSAPVGAEVDAEQQQQHGRDAR